MNINILQNMDPGVGSGDILEQLLAFVFAAQIERAYRKGLYRRYRTYECNDSKVKGKIDITRHIRLNPLNNGKIAYSYREYTADNDVNKMIFTAYTYLQKRHPKHRNLSSASAERSPIPYTMTGKKYARQQSWSCGTWGFLLEMHRQKKRFTASWLIWTGYGNSICKVFWKMK